MRMLAYDSGITLFTIDELIPYAVASLLLCIAYFIGEIKCFTFLDHMVQTWYIIHRGGKENGN